MGVIDDEGGGTGAAEIDGAMIEGDSDESTAMENINLIS